MTRDVFWFLLDSNKIKWIYQTSLLILRCFSREKALEILSCQEFAKISNKNMSNENMSGSHV